MTKLFKNQSSKTPRLNNLINIAINLKETGKGEFDTKTNEYGENFIGIRLNNSVCWYWFELLFDYDLKKFTKRYSMTTQKFDKGVSSQVLFLQQLGYYND